MEQQVFINEMQARFNLRQPKANKPTNIYLVVRINGKQLKLATGVKVYPEHWNKEKQEAYVSFRLPELDNRNNEIANNKINELKVSFSECKKYFCDNPDKIADSLNILKDKIYKGQIKMRNVSVKPATYAMDGFISENLNIGDSTKKIYHGNVNKFRRFLKANGISDSWNNMNLETFNSYQQSYIDVGSKNKTIKTVFSMFEMLLKEADSKHNIPFSYAESGMRSFRLYKNRNEKETVRIVLTEEEIDKLAMPVELHEKDKEYTVKAELPGVKKEDLDIDIDKNHITINAKKEEENKEDTKGYRKSEFRYGEFSRTVYFPQEIDVEKTSAKLEHGILRIEAPKLAAEKEGIKKLTVN